MPSSDVEGHRAFKAMVTHSELTIPPLRTPRWTEKTAIFFSAGITSTSFLQHDAVSIEFTVTITSHASDSAVQCANVTSDDYGTSPISHHIRVSLEYKSINRRHRMINHTMDTMEWILRLTGTSRGLLPFAAPGGTNKIRRVAAIEGGWHGAPSGPIPTISISAYPVVLSRPHRYSAMCFDSLDRWSLSE
jgi:hypothetical protein